MTQEPVVVYEEEIHIRASTGPLLDGSEILLEDPRELGIARSLWLAASPEHLSL